MANSDPALGPYACVGKRLAMLEIRRVAAEILHRYDVVPGPDHNVEAFLNAKQDTFTTVPGELSLIFTKRFQRE